MARIPIVAGNWKMNRTIGPAIDLAAAIKRSLGEFDDCTVVICPPFTALKPVGDLVRFSRVRLGAQDLHFERRGAFTGGISAEMLVDLGCEYVVVGHSERRAGLGETDEVVRRKATAALDAGLTPIVCVGEGRADREAGRTEAILGSQFAGSLEPLGPRIGEVVVAYEPVWAIGTGETATPGEAQDAHAHLRALIRASAGAAAADQVRIQYGGSVNRDNAAAIFSQPDVDGGLIGGASLDADAFVSIVRAAR
jgi:triosephosphate isomerase